MEFVARLRIQKEDMIVEWQHQIGVDGGTEFHLLLHQSERRRPNLARPSSIAVIAGGPAHMDLKRPLFLRRCRYRHESYGPHAPSTRAHAHTARTPHLHNPALSFHPPTC